MKRFFISDLHFGHENVIRYENRPFKNGKDMEESIIKNWNKTVSKKDMIFILGDISFLNVEETTKIIAKLNGRKCLIMGNHDTKSVKAYELMGFEFVSKYPIIIDKFYICSHEPLYLCHSMPYANIHGHIHSKRMEGGNYFNVSVEQINYTPINFDAIKLSLSKNKDHRTIDERINDVKIFDAQKQLEHANKERIKLAQRIIELEKIIQEQTR